MNAVGKIIDNSSNHLYISLPEEYKNKKLELIVMALDENVSASALQKFDFLISQGKQMLSQNKKMKG